MCTGSGATNNTLDMLDENETFYRIYTYITCEYTPLLPSAPH